MRGDTHRLYFPAGLKVEETPQTHEVLSRKTAVDVSKALLAAPGITQAELGSLLGVNQTTLSYNLRRLVEAGLVVAEGARPKRYTPTTTLERLVAR